MYAAVTRLLIAAPALLSAVWQQESVQLARTYKSDEAGFYTIEAKGTYSYQDLAASAKLSYKVTKLLDGGKAKAEYRLTAVNVLIGGADRSEDVDSFGTTLDAAGLPDGLPSAKAELFYTMAALAQVMPTKPIKPGGEFEVNWSSSSKPASIKGKGRFLEIVELEGAKAAKIEVDLEFQPEEVPVPGRLKATNWIDVSTGIPLKSEGKIVVADMMELNYKFARTKRG